jgi:two-component system CheB/CheR fusion protein
MRIQRFTPAVTQIFNLIPTDAGRPVAHLASNLVGYDHLVEDLEAVLDTLVAKEIEVQTKAGGWFSLRIRPYRTLDNVIEGAVVTLIDVTELKRAREAQRETEDLRRLAVVVRDAPAAITVQDPQGHILAWNPAAERLYGFSESEALARNVGDLTPEPLRADALARVRRLRGSEVLQPYRTQRVCKDGRVVDVRVIATALVNNAGEAYAIATTEQEIAADRWEEVEGGHQEGRGHE